MKQMVTRLWIPVLLLAGLLAGCAGAKEGDFAQIPAGKAYADGATIYFTHTETSDPDVADLLTGMMDSPVLLVPSLADAPDSMLADVYVFQNGISGMGPFGFQADVFDNPPGSAGYSPLRRVILVNWQDESQAKELKSVAEIQDLQSQGLLTVEESEIVVNMPFITWDGGQR
jgi:hypothetical protein